MSTLHVVEEILRERAVPMVVREIVELAGERLPTKSKTPDTVVARDLAMNIKRLGDDSKFVRTSPGHYTLRELAKPEMFAAGSSQVVEVPAESAAFAHDFAAADAAPRAAASSDA